MIKVLVYVDPITKSEITLHVAWPNNVSAMWPDSVVINDVAYVLKLNQ